MPIAGSGEAFRALFPDDLLGPILQMVLSSWSRFPAPSSDEHENPITGRFISYLRREKDRKTLPFQIHLETSESDPATGVVKYRIDLKLIRGYSESVYFAFECKRLRYLSGSGTRANYSEYIGEDGMMCFISGRYSDGLSGGSMIGYVMDGDLNRAIKGVGSSIAKERASLAMPSSGNLNRSSLLPNSHEVRETCHTVDSRPFTIHHVFLPVQRTS